jgi:type II secretory pathway pseudopilin PulG
MGIGTPFRPLEASRRAADTTTMLRRLRRESGFGLIELLIAMLLLNIAFLALLATFSSGTIAIRRAARNSTASSLADSQMELYRGLKYSSIALDQTLVNTTDTTYRNDSALGGSTSNDIPCTTTLTASVTTNAVAQAVTAASMTNIVAGSSLTVDTGASAETVSVSAVTSTTFTAIFTKNHSSGATVQAAQCGSGLNQSNPSRSLTGPDGHPYRVDTYITSLTPTSGRAGKLVTVVVRDGSSLTGPPLARVATDVDASTAS